MNDKQPPELNEAENSERSENEKSEEFLNFENAMRKIMRQNPDDAKKIREKPIPPDPEEKPSN